MKKLSTISGIIIAILVGWFFYEKPQPPFAGVTPTSIVDSATYFAEIDKNGTVLRVLVIDQKNIDTGKWGDPKNWIQTYPDSSQKGHYAGTGFTYDLNSDNFIPPKPYNSWVIDTVKVEWKSAKPMPSGKEIDYRWNEQTLNWEHK